MLFLKVTKSVNSFAGRFGWLLAELVFVFMGLYGAFLLERMHDEDMDLLRKRQILQALIDEFENYESELGSSVNQWMKHMAALFSVPTEPANDPFPNPSPTVAWEA